MHVIDRTGHKYQRVTVLFRVEKPAHCRHDTVFWQCVCDCGTRFVTSSQNLRSGDTQSCGCWRRERKPRLTHGRSRTAEHRSWIHAKDRCYNTKDKHWHDYGGRGITMCPEWKASFAAFFRDMGPRPSSGHTLDRRDNDGDYTPDNCRWATPQQQAANRRYCIRIEFQGKTMTAPEWEREFGFSRNCIRNRIKSGWPIDKAMTAPMRRW